MPKKYLDYSGLSYFWSKLKGQKGVANGFCPLDSSGQIEPTYIPGYLDNIIEAYARSGQTPLSSTWLATESASGTVITPSVSCVYILMSAADGYNANTIFGWNGISYVEISSGENEIDYEVDPIESVTFTAFGKNWWFRRVGNIVYLDAPNDIQSCASGWNSIGTLPTGLRPKYIQRIDVGNANGVNRGFLDIDPTGPVRYYAPSALSSATNNSFSTSYIAGDADRYVFPYANMPIMTSRTYNCQITWNSTSNPFQLLGKNVAVSGYTPISFSYYVNGTGATTVFCYTKWLNGDNVTLGLRMNGTPSSTTQNTVDLKVWYIKDEFVV